MTCLQCGNCTGVCPISLKIDYKTRSIMKYCQFGLRKYTLGTRWVCATCYRCYEHCPADINPAEVMIALRHIAVREGIHPAVREDRRDQPREVRPERQARPRDRQDPEGAGARAEVHSKHAGVPDGLREIQVLVHASKYDKLIGIEEEVKV